MYNVFWLSVAMLGYIYLGYPVLIALISVVAKRPHRRAPNKESISIVIAAYNEAARLPGKIRSLLASDAAERIVEILIVSDGSTDGTPAAAAGAGDARVRVIEVPERRGKPAALNDAIPQCKAPIVVLTDARQEVHPQALARLTAALADPEVGAVSGELVFPEALQKTTTARGLNLYWEYEKWIRKREAIVASVPGATGALYAIRRELFKPIPAATLLDDVAIPMQVVAQGKRCVFEPEAWVYDEPSGTPEQEAVRKRRTIAGNAQLVRLMPWLLLPWRNPIWFQFVSHKLLRLTSPLFLVLMLVSNVALCACPVYVSLQVAQGLFYVLAAVGWVMQRTGRQFALGGAALMFLSLNWTTMLALGDAVRSTYRVTWERAGKNP